MNASQYLVERWRAFESARLAWHDGTGSAEAFDEAKGLFANAAAREIGESVALLSAEAPLALKAAA